METQELKAKAYDILAQIEMLQRELHTVNQKIMESADKKLEDTNDARG